MVGSSCLGPCRAVGVTVAQTFELRGVLMTDRRSTVKKRWRMGLLVVLLAGLLSGMGAPGVEQPAVADPLFETPTSATATGQYRTGLTRAGLVSLEAAGAAHVWLGLQSSNDKSATFDVQVELLNNGSP